jgi:hypothetical protein
MTGFQEEMLLSLIRRKFVAVPIPAPARPPHVPEPPVGPLVEGVTIGEVLTTVSAMQAEINDILTPQSIPAPLPGARSLVEKLGDVLDSEGPGGATSLVVDEDIRLVETMAAGYVEEILHAPVATEFNEIVAGLITLTGWDQTTARAYTCRAQSKYRQEIESAYFREDLRENTRHRNGSSGGGGSHSSPSDRDAMAEAAEAQAEADSYGKTVRGTPENGAKMSALQRVRWAKSRAAAQMPEHSSDQAQFGGES